MNNLILTSEQQLAYDSIGQDKSLFLSGSAGTGKSLIITEKIKNDIRGKIILCATTNQAAFLLTKKLDTGVRVPTLHSVLGMKPVNDGSTKENDKLVDFYFSTTSKNMVSLLGKSLIIDESSMISLEIEKYILDLLKFGNLNSVTFVGDKYQLATVKGEAFNYSLIEQVIELKQVLRAKGDLLDYYNSIRNNIIKNEPLELYSKAKFFDNELDFVNYMKGKTNKIIITYTNESASKYSSLIDSKELYVNQKCNALSSCSFNHHELSSKISIQNNSTITINKIFNSYRQMKRDAVYSDYDYNLPAEPIELELTNIIYVKAINDNKEIVYISVWTGSKNEKESLYLNKFTREYRKFQDNLKHSINTTIWRKYAKSDGYLKSLSVLKNYISLPKNILQYERVYWNNFHVINHSMILRSIYVTTAHRAQGATVETVGIDIDDLSKSEDSKLLYVALTRASKELVFYQGIQNAD